MRVRAGEVGEGVCIGSAGFAAEDVTLRPAPAPCTLHPAGDSDWLSMEWGVCGSM